MYSQWMVRVDLVIKEQLPIIWIVCFYKHNFFNIAYEISANSFIVHNMMYTKRLTLLNLKIIICTYLIGCYKSKNRAQSENETESKRKYRYEYELSNFPTHLLEFQHYCKQCAHSYKKGLDRKTYLDYWIWCFPVLGEREKLLPETPLINKD